MFWEIYAANPRSLHHNLRLRDTIKFCYPALYNLKEEFQKDERIEPNIESEIKMRVDMILEQLNIPYQKEVYMLSRHIDFYLPEDGVILELDGSVHFHPECLEYDDKSAYRNMQFLYSGYKLLVINIQEYNSNREIPELMALFKAKLAQVRKPECVAVL